MLQNNAEDYYMICLSYNEIDRLQGVKYQFIRKRDIPNERIEELKVRADRDMKNRELSYLFHNKQKKMYPNDPCPCGSGKKYKKCCGR